ncbi:MAG: hypothetical protein RhofKO_15450 [Rhodothermales bacterium]
MHGYSTDLRQRVVQAYLDGEGSHAQLAHRFKVSAKTVYNWIKRFRQTGSVEPAGYAGGPQPKLDSEGLAYLQHLIDEQPDTTLAELAHRLEERTGVRLHESTVWRYCERLGQTYKKNATRQ